MFWSVLEALVRGCTGFEPYGARKCVNQRVRTPAHASTKFLVWLKTRASMVSLCAEKFMRSHSGMHRLLAWAHSCNIDDTQTTVHSL